MRPLYVVTAVALGLGLAGWAALAGPKEAPRPAPPDPIPGELPAPVRPAAGPRPAAGEPFEDDPLPPRAKPAVKDQDPPRGRPVRVIDPVDAPDLPGMPKRTPLKPDAGPDSTRLKPTVFIPYPSVLDDPKADDPKPLPKIVEDPKPAPKGVEPQRLPRVDLKPVPGIPLEPAAPAAPAARPASIPLDPTVSAAPPPAMAPAAPTGAAAQQEPAVRLEWHGPTTLQVGSPADYTLIARNTCGIPLHKMIVQVKVPAGAKVGATEPKADGTPAVLVWDHGTVQPGEEKVMKMSFVPPGKGEMLTQAWVTFTGSAAVKAQVREPKLAVAAKAPEKVAVGEPATVLVTVSNPGDHPADGVRLAVALGDGLESPKGPRVSIDLSSIGPGETREVKVPCVARASGAQTCDITVEGAGGLKANTATAVTVIQPKLHLEVAGPKLRYLDRKAAYVVKVTNTGDAAAGGVLVTELVPSGFKFVSADGDGKFDPDARTLAWALGDLGPGQGRELKFELLATGTGEFAHKVTAAGDRGARAEQSVTTRVEGVSAVAMEVVDTDDPVEAGADTTYEIRVANTGSKDESDVRLVCALPPQLKFKTATGPGRYEVVGTDVVFDVVKRLPARGEVTFKVTVTAVSKGDARFKATLTAAGLSEPVIKQESTRIYAD